MNNGARGKVERPAFGGRLRIKLIVGLGAVAAAALLNARFLVLTRRLTAEHVAKEEVLSPADGLALETVEVIAD